MEYKIGQRVDHKNQGEGYVISIRPDRLHLVVKFLDGIKIVCRADYCAQLYKPGDQVRVIATEEKLKELYLYDYCATGSIIPVDDYIPGIMGSDIISDSYSVPLEFIEWHSGPKVATKQSSGSRDFVAGDDGYFYFGGMSPEEYIKWLKDDTILVAEVHQDKERNRAALAEVLKIQEPTTNKWMCPKCRFAGSIPDVRQHCVVAHGESLPPPESKSYWETWRVS